MWCDNEALYECDVVIGITGVVGPKQSVVFGSLNDAEIWTCDALMCLLHRHMGGIICGGKDGCEIIDHCPYCAKNPMDLLPMIKDDADEIRRKRHAEIRRSRFKVA